MFPFLLNLSIKHYKVYEEVLSDMYLASGNWDVPWPDYYPDLLNAMNVCEVNCGVLLRKVQAFIVKDPTEANLEKVKKEFGDVKTEYVKSETWANNIINEHKSQSSSPTKKRPHSEIPDLD